MTREREINKGDSRKNNYKIQKHKLFLVYNHSKLSVYPCIFFNVAVGIIFLILSFCMISFMK